MNVGEEPGGSIGASVDELYVRQGALVVKWLHQLLFTFKVEGLILKVSDLSLTLIHVKL